MKILVTGSALVLRLLECGDTVIGIDNHNDYYYRAIKESQLERYANHPNYTHLHIDLGDSQAMEDCFATYQPQCVVNLAVQRALLHRESARINSA